ncbi:MAG: FliH/SctL family protein [Syntrophobacteraceae bacterium]|nr:FliH/SctL family protein [Syntrophobacteraceae bacterium]
MSRIIKAFESESESICAFSFSEIVEAAECDQPGEDVLESPCREVEPDPLVDLESLVQQRLLEAERRAQELEQEGYEKGYAQGLKDGAEFGRKSMQVAREQFEALLERLMSLPKAVIEDYRDWFISSCLAVSRHIALGELQTNPRILTQLMEGLLSEAEEAQGITLHLHPKDLDLLNKHSSLEEMVAKAEKTFSIRPDPEMPRGGCRLESDIQLIDASLENRLSLIEKTILETRDLEEDESELNGA